MRCTPGGSRRCPALTAELVPPSAELPGSNDLLEELTPRQLDFDELVERYGRAEASRRWLAIFGAYDGAET